MIWIKNKTTLKYAVTFILFLSILLGIRWLWSGIFLTPDHPRAVQGVIDLRGWDFANSRSITLDGEWDFYPEAFFTHKNKDWKSEDKRNIMVPGDWRSALPAGSKSSFGFGTYRLRILVDPLPQQSFEFWIQEIQASSVVEFNGQIAGIGQPTEQANTYKPRRISYTPLYKANGVNEIELLVRVANFDNPFNGGVVRTIRFGSDTAINTERWISIGFQIMTFVVLMFLGLYAVMLYLLSWQKGLLAFFMLVLTAGITIVSDNDSLLLVGMPFINYAWALKIKIISYSLFPFFFLMITGIFAKLRTNTVLFRTYAIVLVLYSGFVLVMSPPLIYYLIEFKIFRLLYWFPMTWVIYLIGKLIAKNQPGATFLLLATMSILSSSAWGLINAHLEVIRVYFPFDVLVAIISFSAYWFKQYFRNYQENAKLNEQFRMADKQKDDFLANTSHELRNPLHGMLNMAQTVLDNEKNSMSGESVKNLELVMTVGRRMSLMLNDLLDLTRLKEGNIRLHVQTVQVQAVASGVFDMLRFMTDSKPIRLVNEIPNEFPPVMADENRLIQILYNLVHNAIKYTNEGNVSIRVVALDGKAYISVADTGVGMDEETLRRIFNPYEQGDSSMTAAPGGGIGLGLGICKQLVELHGETLEVTSVSGKGSAFTFALALSDSPFQREADFAAGLPVYAEAAVADDSNIHYGTNGDSAVVERTVKPSVLAVDDDPINLKILENILSGESFDIFAVTSGNDALSHLNTRVWDLVIADVMMPHMSGYELTRVIRERYSSSELPILLLTARNKPEDIAAGFLAGANDYILKPADAMELKVRVRALTDLNRSVRERLRMEAAWLQAQIQPHFLFNALNAIAALSDINLDRMRLLLDEFGNYLRASFNFQNSELLVPLGQELALVRSYLYIENERFEGRLNTVWEVEANMELKLPPLSIQPIVENAVRHGIMSRLSGGVIHIHIAEYEDRTEVTVADNGVGMDTKTRQHIFDKRSNLRQGVGLFNINQRLKQLYGKGLHIQSDLGQGTIVVFAVPNNAVNQLI
ncbi:histidine kinase [Paenibacillus sp. FSL A5-0031]|uniref:hybrid sensor histidine kinase/response regulator n=1 Tax=Paenibacillus sp. FSL A5-0031 TaxID=1920420 RepID=UPI00096F0E44|nr:ATP-binding protein [Paenibacillus sp. FSL A5-0031]OME72028.1 histidine kinase [Paenibacillus sp. FSL A5-0031]